MLVGVLRCSCRCPKAAIFPVGVLQASLAPEAGMTEGEQQCDIPAMMPHEQAATEAVQAAVLAQEAAWQALLKAQQAQQAQHDYIAAEVARQVQGKAAEMQQDLDAARQAAESAREVEAASRTQLAQHAQQAQQALKHEVACQVNAFKKAAEDATLNCKAEAEVARQAEARSAELQQQLDSALQAAAAAQAAEAASNAKLIKQAHQTEQAIAAQAARLKKASDAKLAQQAAELTQAAEAATQQMLAQAQRVQEATQAAFRQAADSAKLAKEAAAAEQAAELAAIAEAAREIQEEEEAEQQLQTAQKRESAQAAWDEALSTLHSLVPAIGGPHTVIAPLYPLSTYPVPEYEERYTMLSRDGLCIVQEPQLERSETYRRQGELPALESLLIMGDICRRSGHHPGALIHFTKVSSSRQHTMLH